MGEVGSGATGFVYEVRDRRTRRSFVGSCADGGADPDQVVRAEVARLQREGPAAFARSLRAHPRTFEVSVRASGVPLAALPAAELEEGARAHAATPEGYSPVLGGDPAATDALRLAYFESDRYAQAVQDRLTRAEKKSRRARRWRATLRA